MSVQLLCKGKSCGKNLFDEGTETLSSFAFCGKCIKCEKCRECIECEFGECKNCGDCGDCNTDKFGYFFCQDCYDNSNLSCYYGNFVIFYGEKTTRHNKFCLNFFKFKLYKKPSLKSILEPIIKRLENRMNRSVKKEGY